MSAALVRRGLELLSVDLKEGRDMKKKQKAQKVTELGGSQKYSKRRLGRPAAGQSRATVKNKRTRSAVEEFRRKQQKRQMGVDLQYFLQSHSKAAHYETSKILYQHSGRQSRNRPERPVEKAKEPQSLFTEDEFQQFQKDYFGKTVEKQEPKPRTVYNSFSEA